MKKKESLYQPRKLTYEEHNKIDAFLRHFHDEGMEIFDLLRQAYGDYEEPVKRMSKAINSMSGLPSYLETKSYTDKIYPILADFEESEKWRKLYCGIGLWYTEGWK